MPGPIADPRAKRTNKDGQFTTIVRRPDREIPEFPASMEAGVPVHLWDAANLYWTTAWVEMGDALSPMDALILARAAILQCTIIDLGAEVPGVMLTNLAKLEDSLGLSLVARRRLRLTVVDEDHGEKKVSGPDLKVVADDFISRRGASAG